MELIFDKPDKISMKDCYLVFDGDYSSSAFRLQIICIFFNSSAKRPDHSELGQNLEVLTCTYIVGDISAIFYWLQEDQTVYHIIVCRQNLV